MSNSGSKIAGNALGGLLVQSVGAALAVGLDAVSYLVSIVSLLFVRKHEPAHEGPKLSLRQMYAEIVEGLHLVLRSPDLRRITCATGTTNFGGGMGGAVLLIFAYRVLHVSPGLLGFLFGIANLGFVGALASSWLRERFGLRNVLLASLMVSGASGALLLLAQFGAVPVFVVLSTALAAVAVPIYNVNQISYRQGLVDVALQGRLNATVRTILSTAAAAWLWDLRERPPSVILSAARRA
jgi:hypothetical protein